MTGGSGKKEISDRKTDFQELRDADCREHREFVVVVVVGAEVRR